MILVLIVLIVGILALAGAIKEKSNRGWIAPTVIIVGAVGMGGCMLIEPVRQIWKSPSVKGSTAASRPTAVIPIDPEVMRIASYVGVLELNNEVSKQSWCILAGAVEGASGTKNPTQPAS